MTRLLMTRLSAVGCITLLAATLSPAQDSKVGSEPPTKSAVSDSRNSATSHSKRAKSTGTSAHSTAKSTSKSKRSRKSAANRRSHGQQKIDPKRTLEIQDALIREHYLDGKASGVWNDATQRAMQRYQADNSWQSKTTPDARALIKLGLGPDHDHLLNPESAMTSQPQAAPGVSTPAGTPNPDKQQR